MAVRKGFINTLEAVISSALILGVVLTTSNFAAEMDAGASLDRYFSTNLDSLDKKGVLNQDISNIEEDMESYIPEDLDYSVEYTEVEHETFNIDLDEGSFEQILGEEGHRNHMKVWIYRNDGLTIRFDEDTIMDDPNIEGYHEINPDNEEGVLEVEGEGELDLRFEKEMEESSETSDQNEITTINRIITHEGSLRNIRVSLWS